MHTLNILLIEESYILYIYRLDYNLLLKRFDEAFKLAEQNSKHKVSDVHLKYANSLENEKRYKEAEDHYLKASKPAQAIEMYQRLGDFMQAL